MRRSRIQSDGGQTSGSTKKLVKTSKTSKKKANSLKVTAAKSKAKQSSQKKSEGRSSDPEASLGALKRFIGLSLGGGKADKACLAVIEYYPKHNKIFLSRIYEKIKTENNISADTQILDIVSEHRKNLEIVAFDVPLNAPLCFTDSKCCGRIESCAKPHVKWMHEYVNKRNAKNRPKKLFTPYTQRAIELYLSSELEEPFVLNHALGSNLAPLTARANFLSRSIEERCIEVFPKLSIWRIGSSLKIMKSHLRFHKHSVGGDLSRKEIIQALSDHNVVFLYEQDVKMMIENNHAFEAFVCALTAVVDWNGQAEERPKGFPSKEDWISFPQSNIEWGSK